MSSEDQSPEGCLVRFEPDGKSIRVPLGTSILDAAQSRGVLIDSVCGGDGRCGRCKVRIRGAAGIMRGSQKVMLTPETEKTVLACTSTVEGELDVFVPDYSRIGVHKILEASENVPLKAISPLVQKEHFHLSPPTLEDNISDLERLRRVMQISEQHDASVPLEVLRILPNVVRQKDWEVTVSFAETYQGSTMVAIEPGDTRKNCYGICVDVGTTTVVISLIDLVSGKTITTESTYNKQIICGEDVLSRISYAEDHGTHKLTKLISETINYLLSTACEHATEQLGHKVSSSDIVSGTVSGNPTMIHFLLGLDTKNMRLEPYVPVTNAPQCPTAEQLKLIMNKPSLIFISPGRSGYVGGDVLSDVLASGMYQNKKLSLLIDVGTNGEVVLGNKDWLVCCSCSAGPAFEGGEVSSGMRAMNGAIDRINITSSGDVRFGTIGNIDPLGICGSGLVDLLSGLFIQGLIDRSGNLEKDKSDRIRKGEEGELEFFVAKRGKRGLAKGWVDEIQTEISVKESDIQNILRTKAAIYSGCSVLLNSMDRGFDDLSEIIVAGGFGQYLDMRKAIIIGLFPDVDVRKYRFIGNGSLEGARLALLSRHKRRDLFKVYKKLTYFELSVSGVFFEEFTSALFLPHTNLELFPSVKSLIELEKANSE